MLVAADGILLPPGMTLEAYNALTAEQKLDLVWVIESGQGREPAEYRGQEALDRIAKTLAADKEKFEKQSKKSNE